MRTSDLGKGVLLIFLPFRVESRSHRWRFDTHGPPVAWFPRFAAARDESRRRGEGTRLPISERARAPGNSGASTGRDSGCRWPLARHVRRHSA